MYRRITKRGRQLGLLKRKRIHKNARNHLREERNEYSAAVCYGQKTLAHLFKQIHCGAKEKVIMVCEM